MFFFGKKQNADFDLAQKLFRILGDSAQADLKEKIINQRSLMKKAKRCNLDSSLTLYFQRLPDTARPVNHSQKEVPFASIHLTENGKDFYADFNIKPDGSICTIRFTRYPNGLDFESVSVHFYPHILEKGNFIPTQTASFRISEKLVSILGSEWGRDFTPPKGQDNGDEEGDDEITYYPAFPIELRQEWEQLIHTELPGDWHEFSSCFYSLKYCNATIYGCCEELQLIPMKPGDTAMYLVARLANENSPIGESFIMASADKEKQNTLYLLKDYDGGESDCIPIGTDLFGFIRKAQNQDYLDSL